MPNSNSYGNLESVINEINRKHIALPEDEVKRNNHIIKALVDKMVAKMKDKDKLFAALYKEKYYGGSYYDDLRVGQPTEYDLDLVLTLPKILRPEVITSRKYPGFVKIALNRPRDLSKRDEALSYIHLEELTTEQQGRSLLSTKQVLSWIETLVTRSLNDFKGLMLLHLKNGDQIPKYPIVVKSTKSGPAMTLRLECPGGYKIDIDLVACFAFKGAQHWPSRESCYRCNPCAKRETFLAVPKSPRDLLFCHGRDTFWRLSFQEQERELISGFRNLKPALRLMKKLRDRHEHHNIASYHIKTVFLWQVDEDPFLFDKPCGYVFMKMLIKYRSCLQKGNIPYFWNRDNNLIAQPSQATTVNIANRLTNIIDDIEHNLNKDPCRIAKYLLNASEIECLTRRPMEAR